MSRRRSGARLLDAAPDAIGAPPGGACEPARGPSTPRRQRRVDYPHNPDVKVVYYPAKEGIHQQGRTRTVQ